MDFNEFEKLAKKKHNNRYEYVESSWLCFSKSLTAICPDHGEVRVRPKNHLLGASCWRCARSKKGVQVRKSNETFVSQCKEIHGESLCFDDCCYYNLKTKVKISCVTHGQFLQWPGALLQGVGCSMCNGYGKSKDQVIQELTLIHEGRYSYERFEYSGALSKSTITCSIHGDFRQTVSDHRCGRGCAECTNDLRRSGALWKQASAYGLRGFYSSDKKSNLYMIRIGSKAIKVGLSVNLRRRLTTIIRESGVSDCEVISYVSGPAKKLWELEQNYHEGFIGETFIPDTKKFKGRGECYPLSMEDSTLTWLNGLLESNPELTRS